jgi:hypothetical protein
MTYCHHPVQWEMSFTPTLLSLLFQNKSKMSYAKIRNMWSRHISLCEFSLFILAYPQGFKNTVERYIKTFML